MNHVCFKLPYSDEIHVCAQVAGNKLCLAKPADLKALSGFVIAPFEVSDRNPLILIRPDLHFASHKKENIYNFLKTHHLLCEKTGADSSFLPGTDVQTLYRRAFSDGMELLKKGNLQKLVLSRTSFQKDIQLSDYELFAKATEFYPDNYIVWFDTPETGSWLSITPELLLSERKGLFTTTALAATRRVPDVSQPDSVVWNEKDRLEQRLVADYIRNILSAMDVPFSEGDLQVVRAGNLLHLRSIFQFRLEKEKRGTLLQLLHPTPAVCGLPKVSAFEFITQNESIPRGYYSGFTGCFNYLEHTELYVTLRCLKRLGPDALLYAGGGILPMSDINKEWLETEAKLLTINRILRNDF